MSTKSFRNTSNIPPWAEWWQTDIPCHYSPAQAAENAAYLLDVLGSRFLGDAQHPVVQVKHPILQKWRTRGAGAFLELNALAMDIRVVEKTLGFDTVLADLKNADTCLPTWHSMHCAALLSRATGSSLLRFYPQTEETLPDFLLSTTDGPVACEAKLLAKSGQEDRFEAYATALSHRVLTEVLVSNEVHPTLTIVLKNIDDLPDYDELVQRLREGQAFFTGNPITSRTAKFNLFLEPAMHLALSTELYKSCYILCPKSEKEDLRVHQRGKKASKQLSSQSVAQYPGLLLLGVTRLQNPAFVVRLFRQRFAAGQYPGISGALLVLTGTQMQLPRLALLDMLATVRNQYAQMQLPKLHLGPVGLLAPLCSQLDEGEIPAYRHQVQQMKLRARESGICMPDLRSLSPDLLADV